MKAVFIHDHNFVYDKKENKYFDGSGGVFAESLWRRYLDIFDELVVVGREKEGLPNQLVSAMCDNVSFELIRNANSIKNLLFNKTVILNKIEEIVGKSDFVIIRLPSFLGAMAFKICLKYNIPYVLEIVGDPYDAYWFHGSIIGKIIAPYEMIKLKLIVKRAKNVIYVTQSKLQIRYPNPNNNIGISNVRLLEVVCENRVKEFYSLKKEMFKVGLIGTFHVKYKGQEEAIKAIGRLKKKGYNRIQLFLVGTGDYEWISDLARKYDVVKEVTIVGALASGNRGILPFIDSLDCYIHPSRTEGLPRVVIEAMSRGKICLTSNAGGVEELIHGDFVHEAGDWKILSLHLEKCFNLGCQEKIEVALNNLSKSNFYLEDYLQSKRIEFIKNIV